MVPLIVCWGLFKSLLGFTGGQSSKPPHMDLAIVTYCHAYVTVILISEARLSGTSITYFFLLMFLAFDVTLFKYCYYYCPWQDCFIYILKEDGS